MGICLLLWCLGQGPAASEHLTFTHDVRDTNRSERILAYDISRIVAGVVTQSTASEAAFLGYLPLQINIRNGLLVIDGGGIVATANVPQAGTRANFMARAQLRVTDRIALVYWHWSNGELGDRNPAVDSIGISVRLRQRRTEPVPHGQTESLTP
ncbi:MAG TPA: hypothetical protein VNT81_01315 [Vicinamibacterales bacterium]|nr:hypothetical protein [Vicinamibacterales bacterium]